MSEPLSTNEIEDVVSSVRRLVSPEARPRPMSRDLGMDRLILTPSFRIVAEQVSSGPTIVKLEAVPKKAKAATRKARVDKAASAGAGGVATAGPAVMAGIVGEASGQGFGKPGTSLAEMALRAEEAEVIVGDDSAKPARAAVKAGKTSAKALDKTSAGGEVASAALPEKPARKTSKTVSKLEVGSTEKDEGKVVASLSDAGKVRGKAAALKSGTPVVAPVDAMVAGPAPKTAKAKPAVTPTAEKQGKARKPRVVAAEPAQVESPTVEVPAVSEVSEPAVLLPVPDGGFADGAGGAFAAATGPAAVDQMTDAFPELDEENTGTSLPVVETVSVMTDPNGNTISLLDEEALVLLLRRLIREELQGVLGEKITRNVRKLVRAEVARSLTEQTLD